MRVIETFVTSVPREKIPADAKWFMQGPVTGGLLAVSGADVPISFCNMWARCKKTNCLETQPVSSDAAETVVTRDELMRAYDLVEQGYTLWFGGECPVEKGTLVDVVYRDGFKVDNVKLVTEEIKNVFNSREHVILGRSVIAYRLSRSVDKDIVPVLKVDSDALKTRLEMLNKMTGGVWPGADDEKFLVTADGKQLIRHNPEKLITRAQWDDYVSRKIRVGDKVKTRGGHEVEVLFTTEKVALVRYDDGIELAINLNRLTRISQ